MKHRQPPSFSLSLPEETANQVRAALQAVGSHEGYASVNDLLTAATLKEIRRLQRKYNASKPWPGIPAGEIRPGRRTREESQRGSKHGQSST